MDAKYPKRLNPTPIVSSVVEIKYTSSYPSDAIFGILYNALKNLYPKSQKLPILQIPEDMRKNDPNLMSAPHYELSSDNSLLKILIGPKVIGIAFNRTINDYPGWTEYISDRVNEIYNAIFEVKIINEITRFAIRYTDFFEGNIFENTQVTIGLESKNIGIDEQLQIIRTFKQGEYIHNMLISNNAEIMNNGKKQEGSIIDIDSYIVEPKEFVINYKEYLNSCHEINKKIFFDILKKEYVDNTLKAEY